MSTDSGRSFSQMIPTQQGFPYVSSFDVIPDFAPNNPRCWVDPPKLQDVSVAHLREIRCEDI